MGRMVRKPGPARATLTKFIADADKFDVRVGWLSGNKYPTGTPVAYAAAIAEHGSESRSIPPRPMVAPTIERERDNWSKLMGRYAKQIVEGKATAETALNALAGLAVGDVQKTISGITQPPLTLLTLLARKHQLENGGYYQSGITGKTIGELAKKRDNGPPDVSGVSTKPLNWSGLMYNSITYSVTPK